MNERNDGLNRGQSGLIDKALDEILYRINGYTDDDDKIIADMEHANSVFDRIFEQRMVKIEAIDAARLQAAKGLADENNFLENEPNLQLVPFIAGIYTRSFRNPVRFMAELRAQRAIIRQRFAGELSEFVLGQLGRTERQFGPMERIGILLQLWGELEQDAQKDRIIAFMKTPPHAQNIRAAILAMPNRKAKKKIADAVSAITNEELEWLIKYIEEVRAWLGSEFIKQDIGFFQRATNAILYNPSQEKHPGLISIFNDDKLKKMLEASPAFLLFTRYNLMKLYIKKLRDRLREKLESGFWIAGREAKKIHGTLVRQFGNSRLAAEFFAEIRYKRGLFGRGKAQRQYPAELLRFFEQAYIRVESIEYQRTEVIEPFIREMDRIFSIRAAQLSGGGKGTVENLKLALMPIAKSEVDCAKNILKRAERIKRKAKRRYEVLRLDFELLSIDCCDAMDEFIEAKARIMDKSLSVEIGKRVRGAAQFVGEVRKFTRKSREVLASNPETSITNPNNNIGLMFLFSQAANYAEGATHNIRSIGKLFSKKVIKRRLLELDRLMENCEKEYEELRIFMQRHLGFLIKTPEQSKTKSAIEVKQNAA